MRPKKEIRAPMVLFTPRRPVPSASSRLFLGSQTIAPLGKNGWSSLRRAQTCDTLLRNKENLDSVQAGSVSGVTGDTSGASPTLQHLLDRKNTIEDD